MISFEHPQSTCGWQRGNFDEKTKTIISSDSCYFPWTGYLGQLDFFQHQTCPHNQSQIPYVSITWNWKRPLPDWLFFNRISCCIFWKPHGTFQIEKSSERTYSCCNWTKRSYFIFEKWSRVSPEEFRQTKTCINAGVFTGSGNCNEWWHNGRFTWTHCRSGVTADRGKVTEV